MTYMQKKLVTLFLFLTIGATGTWWMLHEKKAGRPFEILQSGTDGDDEKDEMAQRQVFVKERLQYEYDMVKNPVTGLIPKGIYKQEFLQASAIPLRVYDQNPFNVLSSPNSPNSTGSVQTGNSYSEAGPYNQGGRTRAVAFDKYNNQVILAGSVSGGIYRSANGGGTWTRVTPEGQIHNLTTIAQDPRPGFKSTWYAGGGEALGNSAAATGAFYLGFGILKSTDNGVTWSALTQSISDIGGAILGAGTLEAFDNAFDIVHKIIVDSATGNVYICAHRRLIRSTDGGTSFNVVFTGSTASTADDGQMDIVSSSVTGRLYLAVNGGFTDKASRGLWTSTSGNAGSWTRIAGGQTLGVDSITGWRANSYDTLQPSPNLYISPKRIVLSLAPSNQNILYALYENGLSQAKASGSHPEVDLFKVDLTNPVAPVFTNLSANMPNFGAAIDGIDPIAVQGGYDLLVAVKPDDPNMVFIGGTNLYRSTDGFSSTANTEWIGGYGKSTSGVKFDTATHPDIHALAFDPGNPKRAICGNDGGIQVLNDITGTSIPLHWVMINNYQTLQYYHVAIDPTSGQNNFIGGAQDNGTFIRQDAGGTPNNQYKIIGGDGGSASIGAFTNTSFTVYGSSQQGTIYRDLLNTFTNITPPTTSLTATTGGGYGEFVTYFKMDFDNPEILFYVNYNKIFRTTTATTVTANSSSGWTNMSGIAGAVNPSNPNAGTNIGIRALELSRGPYLPSHSLYIGTTDGNVYRLDDPKNAAATATPVKITPAGMSGTVSSIAANPNNDAEVLVTVSNYGVPSAYWTGNAKAATPVWVNAEGDLSLPSFRSCTIVVKKDASNNAVQEYYVGTSVGLYSATNINQTLGAGGSVHWVREGANVLNYAIVQSMAYRPQDNVLLLGTHGNGMYYASLGTPNYQPNQSTGINDPVRNDKNFIQFAYPTLARNSVNFTIGNMFTIQKMVVQVHSISGQLMYRKETGYANGSIDISNMASGPYIITITSSDYKQQFIQKIVKQ
jgi:hypothetical protein